jgi:hypothetical protein
MTAFAATSLRPVSASRLVMRVGGATKRTLPAV